MTKKHIVRAVGFLLAVLTMFCFLSDIFENSSNRKNTVPIRTYYSLKPDTLDLALLGTSGIDRYWLASKAFEEHGIASYAVANNAFPSWLLLTMAKELERKHDDLKLLVVDIRPFTVNHIDGNPVKFENRARSLTEALPFFSIARFEAINKALRLRSETFEDKNRFDLSFFFTFIKHHSRWSEEGFDPYAETEYVLSPYMGAYIHKSSAIRPLAEPLKTFISDERMPLDPICLEDLYELLDYFDKQDFEVLFINTPHGQNERETERTNTVCDILAERGYKYLNLEPDSKIYDLQKDFYNTGHVNYYGAEKFTAYLTAYLLESYDLPDRRGDARYSRWEGTYAAIKKSIAKWEQEAQTVSDAEK